MPFWDDEDFGPYEHGGVTGGGVQVDAGGYDSGGEVPTLDDYTPALAAPLQRYTRDELGHGDVRDAMWNVLKGTDGTAAGVQAAIAANPELFRGATLGGKNGDKLDFGNGVIVDVRKGASAGHNEIQWQDPLGQGDAGGSAPAAPLTTASGGSNYAGAGGGGGGRPGLNLGAFEPYKYEDWKAPEAFTAPTMEQAQNDPGYAFGRDQGLQAMTNSAAARGLGRSGGTLKAFGQYGNDYATTKYNELYNRSLNTFNTNTGNSFQANQANNQGRLGAFSANTNAALGFGNLDLGYTRAGNDYSLGQGQLALGNRNADINRELGMANVGLGYGNLGLGQDRLAMDREGQTFNQGYSLADMGLRASSLAGGYGSQYAQNAGNNATGAGNALAAGRVGSANAWTNGLSNAGNAGLSAYGMYQYGQR